MVATNPFIYVFALSFDWFIGFSASVAICQSCFLGVGLTHLTENHSIVLSHFLLRPIADIVVRMAERSKAPDSRLSYLPITQWERAFWSPNGGVGSNPTPDTLFLYFYLFF